MSVHAELKDLPPRVAVEDVLEAAQRTVLDRLHLLALDLKMAAHGVARATAVGAAGAAVLLLGWMCLMGAVASALTQTLPLWGSLASVGLGQCALGAAALCFSIRANATQSVR